MYLKSTALGKVNRKLYKQVSKNEFSIAGINRGKKKKDQKNEGSNQKAHNKENRS